MGQHAATTPKPPASQGGQWWRVRTWANDLPVLKRLRDALDELPEMPEPIPGGRPGGDGAVPSDTAIAAVRASFAAIREDTSSIAYFYARMFTASPLLRELFPVEMTSQRDRLLRALARIVETMDTPEEMAAYLSQLGRDHRKYGVEPWMYGVLGEALLATLRSYAKDLFTAAAEEAWGQLYRAASGIMIRAAEDDPAPAFWEAEVVAHESRGNGITVLSVEPAQALLYNAGQHLTLCTGRYPRVWRQYSAACAPRGDLQIDMHVRAIEGGWVSGTLSRYTGIGDVVTLGPALGSMTLDAAGDRDILCVAGGTGLSPLKALIQQAICDACSGGVQRRIVLVAGARTRAELYDLEGRDGLYRLQDAYGGLEIIPVLSDDPAVRNRGNAGSAAARYLPHFSSGAEAFVAGPPQMVRSTIRSLTAAGLPREQIHYDGALLSSLSPGGGTQGRQS